MDSGTIPANGYLLLVGLIVAGAALLVLSFSVNRAMARSARDGDRHGEKVLEYRRDKLGQVGALLLGIGVSLFSFFFQSDYAERQRHASEVRQLGAKLAVQVGRAAAVANFISEFDPLIAYVDTAGNYKVGTGDALLLQVEKVQALRREVDLGILDALAISSDIADSQLVAELDPQLWFAIAEDENEVRYGRNQLLGDYADLDAALGGLPPAEAVADPARAPGVAAEVDDILHDLDVIRDRGRRLIGRGCRFVAAGPDFLSLKAIPALEADYITHTEWIDVARRELGGLKDGTRDCFGILEYGRHGLPE